MNRNSKERKKMLAERRARQLARKPDVNAFITNFSKNSMPAYRK